MTHSTALSRGFNCETLTGNQIGELYHKRLSLKRSQLYYKRLSTCEVWIEDNITVEDKLFYNTAVKDRL